ncbi:MAG: prolipoprotein diacylglyceryl transferase [Candidatus Absconditabacterales bacterium]
MIAFSIGSMDIYRYGIFYFLAFLAGYLFFHRITKKNIFGKSFPRLQTFLEKYIDDLILCIFAGVLIGGRLGHVIIYDLGYYLQHPGEILQVWKGGMSFIGGIFGVMISLLVLAWKKRLTRKESLLLGDLIFAALPLGIMLGRIGNYLNQELYGVVVTDWLPRLGYPLFSLLNDLNIFHVYSQIDNVLRLNTNLLSSFFEGFILLIITLSIIRQRVKTKTPQPGKIVAVFFIGYSFIRFILEYFRADSQLEFHGRFTTSQRFFIMFFIVGRGGRIWSRKQQKT